MNRQEYLLVHLMEEAAEVQKACSKALRFGLDHLYSNEISTEHPRGRTNREAIEDELSDVGVVFSVMLKEGLLKINERESLRHKAKLGKMEEKYRASVSLGTVKP